MVTSAQEWEELVHRAATVLRAQASHCPAHQEPSPTGQWVQILKENTWHAH